MVAAIVRENIYPPALAERQAVFAQQRHHVVGEWHFTPSAWRLGSCHEDGIIQSDNLLADVEEAPRKVYVFPSQSEQLATPQTQAHRQDVQDGKAMILVRALNFGK